MIFLAGDSRALDRVLALAQSYNDHELVTATGLDAEDASILQIYRTRVLSGSATDLDLDQDEGEHDDVGQEA